MSKKYEENVKNLTQIEATEIENLPGDAFIYFGRGTCRYCCEFSEEFPNAGIEIYYIDTTHTSVDETLQKVRDMYKVQTVPTFIHRQKDGNYKKLNRDTRQSIQNFVASIN